MKRRLIRLGIIVIIILIVLVPTVTLLNHWMSTSASGDISVGTPGAEQTAAPEPSRPVAVTTSRFTTELPAGFTIKRTTETPDAPITLLELLANTNSQTDQQLALSIGILPHEGIRGNGDYNLRASNTVAYTPFRPDAMPAGAQAFRTLSGPASFVVFWPHGTQYAEIALSSDGGSSLTQLQATFSQMMAAWTWK